MVIEIIEFKELAIDLISWEDVELRETQNRLVDDSCEAWHIHCDQCV